MGINVLDTDNILRHYGIRLLFDLVDLNYGHDRVTRPRSSILTAFYDIAACHNLWDPADFMLVWDILA